MPEINVGCADRIRGPGKMAITCVGVAVAVEAHRSRFTGLDKQREIYACHCMKQLALVLCGRARTFPGQIG